MSKSPDEVIRNSRQLLDAHGVKIVKQLMLKKGVTPTEARVIEIEKRWKSEVAPFLQELADWAIALK